MKKIRYTLNDIGLMAGNIVSDLKECSIITLQGTLGSGKTTLVKALANVWGVEQEVFSPTFTYFNQYHGANGLTIYHFDLYRLKSLQEFETAGFFEYLYQPNSIVLIEWPDIILPVLTGAICYIDLDIFSKIERSMNYRIERRS